jgi:hypothetical protein
MYCDGFRAMPREGSEIVKKIVHMHDFDRTGRSLLLCHGKNVPPLSYWPTILTRANRIFAHSKGSTSGKNVLFELLHGTENIAFEGKKEPLKGIKYPREKRASVESELDTEARARWRHKRVLF